MYTEIEYRITCRMPFYLEHPVHTHRHTHTHAYKYTRKQYCTLHSKLAYKVVMQTYKCCLFSFVRIGLLVYVLDGKVYVWMFMFTYVCAIMFVCMFLYVCVCVCVCMCVFECVYVSFWYC